MTGSSIPDRVWSRSLGKAVGTSWVSPRLDAKGNSRIQSEIGQTFST